MAFCPPRAPYADCRGGQLSCGGRREYNLATVIVFVLCSSIQPEGDKMADESQEYKVVVNGPGHSFERNIDEALASQIISLVMTGGAVASLGVNAASNSAAAASPSGPNFGAQGSARSTQVRGSLASYIRDKQADKNQTRRFLVTASWLSGRSSEPLTTTAVAKALLDNHQKRLGNPADCLNKNVSRGFCEKTKDGFFITPEGLEALESSTGE